MAKLKSSRIIRNVKIKPAFFLYVFLFLALSVLLSALTIHVVDNFVSTVAVYYINGNDDVDRINEDNDEDIQIAVDLIDDDFDESTADAILFYARNSTVAVVLIAYFIVGIIIAARVFFKSKLDIPLKELEAAAEKISREDLDFKISYSGSDEMGKLCTSFEKMRVQLLENNKKMWSMIDEQKRVQSVFSHDIRTPLTVTIGYVDILKEYLPEGKLSEEKTEQTLELIGKNLVRLENFVDMMSTMQKLDDLKINPVKTKLSELFRSLEESSRMICWDKQIVFSGHTDSVYGVLDKMIVEQITANIVSNASRYARSKVDINCDYREGHLKITVRDDGRGFSKDALTYALEPYYSEEEKSDTEHFGIGLNICKILCEKSGGTISCKNNNGAEITVLI